MDKPSRNHRADPGAWIHSTRLHLVLYSLLLMATPAVMLRAFLQQGITKVSDARIPVLGLELPVILTAAVTAGILLIVWKWRSITRRHVLAATIVLLMDVVAQQFADYYSDNRFYNLQQNWHYIAYGLFAFMVYRDLAPRGIPLHRILILIVGLAFVMSTSDEWFQRYINTRVFDISDIAKDTYGSVAGAVVIALCSRHAPEFLKDRRLRCARLSNYFRHPLTTLILLGTLSFLLMNTAALLSDAEYFLTALLLAVAIFLVVWMVLHVTQFSKLRYLLFGLAMVVLVVQGYFFWRNRDSGIVYHRFGLTIYRGIPVPYFDLMIHTDGSFRLVDKKHQFLVPDREHFLKERPDILLISSGDSGRGGNGFPSKRPSQFVYNLYSGRGTHVLILNTRDACTTFNRLKKEHKNVLFVIHNTC